MNLIIKSRIVRVACPVVIQVKQAPVPPAPSPSTEFTSRFRSPADSTGVPANMAGMLGETAIPTPDLPEAKGSVACPFRHQPLITNHSPFLFANRGYGELEIVPSPCKQRATLLSNRGRIPVVQPLARESWGAWPPPCVFGDRNSAKLAMVPSHSRQRVTPLSNRHKFHFLRPRVASRERTNAPRALTNVQASFIVGISSRRQRFR
jgi:hypothetical protein